MAAMNGPEFVSCMMRRKDRLDFTSTLGDPRQWPSLGQSTDSEQKKKAAPFGNSSSNFTGKAASSSRIRAGESVPTGRTPSAKPPVTSSPHSTSDHNAHSQMDPDSSGTSNHEDSGSVGEDGLQRHNPDDFSAARKKIVKTKWIPLEIPLPTSRMVLQDKLRLRRQDTYGAAYRPDFARFRPPFAAAPVAPVVPSQAPTTVRPPVVARPVNAVVSSPVAPLNGTLAQANAGPVAVVASLPVRNVNAPFEQNRVAPRFKKPMPPPPPSSYNRLQRGPRKMQSYRSRDIAYDGDYMDGSDGADEGSQHENGDYDNQGYYNGDYSDNSWSANNADWSSSSSMYYDYSGVDVGYSQGYMGEAYADGYTYYPASGSDSATDGGLDQNGLFIPSSPMPALVALVDVELKKMIRYQIEYYFSPDNLQKDFFLRRMMAKDGSVMLGLVATFQRVRALCQDLNVIMESIADSDQVELLDNYMVRPRESPETWPIEEEDEKSIGYYYVNGETDDYGALYPTTGSGFDETDESGTGEDVSYPDEEEDEEDGEEVSMDGSDLSSELSEDIRQEMSKLKPDHLEACNALSEKLLQQVM